MIKVRNLISPNGNPVANQFNITNGADETFQSYETWIGTLMPESAYLLLNKQATTYSKTTSKYLYLWLSELLTYEPPTSAEFKKWREQGYIPSDKNYLHSDITIKEMEV